MRRFAIMSALLVCAAAGCGSDASGPDNQVTVEMRDDNFSPATVTINAGTSVRWRNVGNNTHNTTSSQAGLWSSGNVNSGGTFTRQFDTAGTFAYTCTLHAGMTGTVVVQ